MTSLGEQQQEDERQISSMPVTSKYDKNLDKELVNKFKKKNVSPAADPYLSSIVTTYNTTQKNRKKYAELLGMLKHGEHG